MDDSSNSQQPSHPGSSSSGYDGSASNSLTPTSGSGGSAGETSPSVGNDPQEDVVDVADSSTSTKPQQPKSPAGKGKAEEIRLLTDLYDLLNRTGRYDHVMAGSKQGEPDFYKFWIQEEKQYANKQELDNKIEELHARFMRNMYEDVKGPTDPTDLEILRLSGWIWGGEIDSVEEETDDGDQSQDLADDANMAKDGRNRVNRPDDDDSSRGETAKKVKADHHGVDQVDPKDSTTKESDPIKKD